MSRSIIIYILMMFCATACVAQDNDRGPLSTHASSIFQLSSSEFIPNSSLRVEHDAFATHNSIMWASLYNVNSEYLIDAEFLSVNSSIYYGLTDKWQIGLSVPIHLVGGGELDGAINLFHDVFDLNGNNRDEDANDQFKVVYNSTTELDSEVIIGDITLHSRYQILETNNREFGLSAGLKIQLPTSTTLDWLKHDEIGIGIECAATYTTGDFHLYVASSFAYVGESEILWQKTKSFQTSAVIAIDYRIVNYWSLVVQYTGVSGPIESLGEYSRWSHEIGLGTRITVSEHMAVEIAILENVILYNNSADIGFYAGVTLK